MNTFIAATIKKYNNTPSQKLWRVEEYKKDKSISLNDVRH